MKRILVLLAMLFACSLVGCLGLTVPSVQDASNTDAVDNSESNTTATDDQLSNTSTGTERLQVGDIVYLGTISYESRWRVPVSNDLAWRVLDINDGKALLITQNIIDFRYFDDSGMNVTWEKTDIRTWLNGVFFDGFPADIQRQISTTEVINLDYFGADGGNDTFDRIFLLSIDEVERYFGNDSDCQAGIEVPDSVLVSLDAQFNLDDNPFYKDNIKNTVEEYGGWDWWLRSPGDHNGDYARSSSRIDANGEIKSMGFTDIGGNLIGVRPALWINISPSVLSSSSYGSENRGASQLGDNHQVERNDFIFSDSNIRYLTSGEIDSLTDWQRYIARNEIYARLGRGFNNQDLKDYFDTKIWYKRQYAPEEFDAMGRSALNDYEYQNATLILSIEKNLNSPYL